MRKDTERQELIHQEALSSFIDFMVQFHHELYRVEISNALFLTRRNIVVVTNICRHFEFSYEKSILLCVIKPLKICEPHYE